MPRRSMWRCSADRKSSTRHEAATACANTIGTVRLAPCKAAIVGLAVAKITSGVSATNSVANLRSRSALPPAQRISIRTFSPSVQPNFCRPCRKAAMRACPTGSSAAHAPLSIRGRAARHLFPCWQRGNSDHVRLSGHRGASTSSGVAFLLLCRLFYRAVSLPPPRLRTCMVAAQISTL